MPQRSNPSRDNFHLSIVSGYDARIVPAMYRATHSPVTFNSPCLGLSQLLRISCTTALVVQKSHKRGWAASQSTLFHATSFFFFFFFFFFYFFASSLSIFDSALLKHFTSSFPVDLPLSTSVSLSLLSRLKTYLFYFLSTSDSGDLLEDNTSEDSPRGPRPCQAALTN